MGKDKETSYLPATAHQAQIRLTEGRKELNEALEYMNKIKVEVAQWQDDTKSFFDEVSNVYAEKKDEIERNSSHLPMVSTVKAIWDTLPSLFRREDPTKKRLGTVLNSLVRDAERIYDGLDNQLDLYEKRFENIDTLTGNLIGDSKTYLQNIEEFNVQKKQLEQELKGLEAKLGAKAERDQGYLDIRQQTLEKKRELETVRKERSSALNKYEQTMNILDALEGFRDENQILLTEGRNLHETLDTNITSLKPLFEHVTASADLVEFQRKALDTYDMLKKTFNPAMIAITAVAKGVSKVAAEKMNERFIEGRTIEVVKAIAYQHQEEINKRLDQEDKLIEDLLGKKIKTDEKTVDFEQDAEGTFVSTEEPKEEK